MLQDLITIDVTPNKKSVMIAAYEMTVVAETDAPHASHEMEKWESSIVACASNDRFGRVRACKNCEGRHVAAGGPGSYYMDPELLNPCFAK